MVIRSVRIDRALLVLILFRLVDWEIKLPKMEQYAVLNVEYIKQVSTRGSLSRNKQSSWTSLPFM
jgi:hypothetical protein